MEQTQAGGKLRRVDTALSRLESMIDERLQAEQARGEELAKRLARLDGIHPLASRRRSAVESKSPQTPVNGAISKE
jgi:hypothetical protein